VVSADGVHSVFTRDPAETIHALIERSAKGGWKVENMSIRSASLEDVFVQLTGRRLRE
jgi:hypothetical protein